LPTVVGVSAVVGWEEEKKDGNAVFTVPAVTVPFLRRMDLPDGDLWISDSEGRVSSGGGIATGDRTDTFSFKNGLDVASEEDFGLPFLAENILRTDKLLIALLCGRSVESPPLSSSEMICCCRKVPNTEGARLLCVAILRKLSSRYRSRSLGLVSTGGKSILRRPSLLRRPALP